MKIYYNKLIILKILIFIKNKTSYLRKFFYDNKTKLVPFLILVSNNNESTLYRSPVKQLYNVLVVDILKLSLVISLIALLRRMIIFPIFLLTGKYISYFSSW